MGMKWCEAIEKRMAELEAEKGGPCEKEGQQLKEPALMTPIEHLYYLKTVTLVEGFVGAAGVKDAVSAFIDLVKAEDHCRAVYHPIENAQYIHAQRAVRDAFNRVMGKEEGER